MNLKLYEDRRKILIPFILGYCLAIFGLLSCEKKIYIYSIPERGEIVNILKEKLASEKTISLDGLNDGNAYYVNYSSGKLGKISTDTIPNDSAYYRFGRILHTPSDTLYTFDIKWDSALVWIEYTGNGVFKVVRYDSVLSQVIIDTSWNYFTVPDSMLDSTALDTGDTVYIHFTRNDSSASFDTTRIYEFTETDSSENSFSYTTKQYCIFRRMTNSKEPKNDWLLKKVSPLRLQTSPLDSILEVTISSFFLYKDIYLTPSGLFETFLSRDSLPTFTSLSQVSLTIKVKEDSLELYPPGEMLLLHYGNSISTFKYRQLLDDENNDGVYQYLWKVHPSGPDIYRLWIDLIDMESIFIPGTALHSETWMIPYKVN